MPDYKIYNPVNETGIRPVSYVNTLPAEVQSWLFERLGDELSQFHGAEYPIDSLASELATGMNGRICDVEALVPTSEILDKWALHESFDPNTVDVEEAAWLAFDNAGRQELFFSMLMEDGFSPNGYSWHTSLLSFEPNGYSFAWEPRPIGDYWGYANAYDLLPEIEGLIPAAMRLVEVNPDFAKELFESNSLAREEDIQNYIDAKSEGIDIRKHVVPRAEEQFGPADDTVPGDPAESFSKEELYKLRLAELEAEGMALEQVIAQRDAEIESLQERLAAIEDAKAPSVPAEAAIEMVKSLSLGDFTQRNIYEFTPDEWTHVSIEPADVGCTWTIERAGTKNFGSASSVESALAIVQDRLTEALSFRNDAKPKRSNPPGPDRAAKHANPAADQKAMTAAAKSQSVPSLKPNAKVVS